MRMARDERERKFRSVKMSSDLDRLWDFISELMVDLNAADSDIARALAEMERNAAGLTGRAGDAGKVGGA